MGEEPEKNERLRVVASGGLQIWCGERRVDSAIPAKAALMIAYLADCGAPVSRATLAGLLWSDHPEEQARTSLRVTLTRTRQHVPHVRSDRSTVSLIGDVALDLREIESDEADDVMVHYQGVPLAGIEVDGAELFVDWLVRRSEEHRMLALRSLARAAHRASEEQRWLELVTIGRRMIEIEPWNESAHRHVITATAFTDGRSSALAAFESCAATLLNEFGVAPDDETTALAASIRSGASLAEKPPRKIERPSHRSVAWRLLGDVTVLIDGAVCELGGRHRRSVMALLALNAPERCSIDDLVAAVWGEDPPTTANKSIRRHVRELQDLADELGERIEEVPDGFRLAARSSEVDAIDVRSSIASAQSELRHGELEAAVPALRAAISRWDGASLGGVTRHGQLGAARLALDEIRLGAIEDLVEAELALGRHREIAPEAEAFALEHPTRDRAWANLMLARSRTGRRSAAVEAYREFSASLAADGLAPSQSIVALYHQILDESPAVQTGLDRDSTTSNSWSLPVTTFSVPLPPSFERSAFVTLAGRDQEMGTLEESLAESATSGPMTLFVSGEPGIGKTRLAAELARTAHDSGAAVLYGRCDDSLGVPFQAWREALAHLADHVPHHVARRHLDRFGPALQMLMPSLVPNSNDEAGTGRVPAADVHQQELLFRATADLLGDVSRRRRLVVVIDDMQWAHSGTLDLMRHLARHAPEPIFLLGLYRTTDVPAGHQLHDLVADLEQAKLAQVLSVHGLDAASRSDLVRSMVPAEYGDQAPQIADKIAEETGGNPFFFTEVLRSILESGSVSSVLDKGLDLALPPTVQRVVVQRVAKLGDDVANTLKTASVFGREFDLDVLSAVLSRDEDDVLGDIESALTAGLVTDAPLGRDRFAFGHDLMHHTLIAELSQSRRSRTHGAIAEAIEAIHGPDLGDYLPVVATHLVAADGPSLRSKTVQRCREAGHHAAKQYAIADAVAWFQRALDGLPPGDHQERASVLVELGTQQRNAADPQHCSTLIEAGRIALATGDIETLVSSTLANSRGMNAHVWDLDEERIGMLGATLNALGPVKTAERADLLASLANEQWDDDHRQASEDAYREAMTIARSAGDPATLARVLVRVSRARNFRLDRSEMAAVSEELKRLSDEVDLGDPLLLANCLTTVLNTSIRLGLAAETRTAIDAICAAADDLPLPMFTLPAHLARALDAGLRGDIQQYEQASTDTFHHATSIGDEEAGFIFEGQMFYTAYLRGDLAPILNFSIKIMNERPEVPLYRAVCALVHVEAGKTAEAGRLLDDEVRVGIEPTVDMFGIQALVALADAAASIRHVPACTQLYAALIGLSTEMSGHLVQVGEPIDLSLGRLASVLGQFDVAERHFDIAQNIADSYEGSWMKAITAISRAEMLTHRNNDGDPAAARSIAEEVLPAAEQQNYQGIRRRAESLLALATG